MIAGRVDALGRLYTTSALPSATSSAQGGIMRDALGAVHVLPIAAPARFNGGFGTSNLGQLCYAPGAAIHAWNGGLPFAADGRLITVAMNAVPAGTEPYVGGIRVSELFGVFLTDAVPSTTDGWSTGFDLGFG
jgi:hypothetical protein